jgi:hypothetical protein
MRPGCPLLYIKPSPDPYIDKLVILEDNESDTPKPKPETTIVSVSVDTSTNPVFDLSKLLNPSSHKA